MTIQVDKPINKLLGIFLPGFFISPVMYSMLLHPSNACNAPLQEAMNAVTSAKPAGFITSDDSIKLEKEPLPETNKPPTNKTIAATFAAENIFINRPLVF